MLLGLGFKKKLKSNMGVSNFPKRKCKKKKNH